MDGYQLTAVIFQSIAKLGWPIALCVIVWMFRSKLLELLPGMRVKHKDWEASFRLEKAEQEVAALPPGPAGQAAPPTPEEKNRFAEIARLSPRAAILEVRAELEEALRSAGSSYGLEAWTRKGASLLLMTRELREFGLIDTHMAAILDDLRSVGNRAAHSGESILTVEDAERFKRLSDEVVGRLNARVPEVR